MTNPLQRIKAKQIADALEKGDTSPYDSPSVVAEAPEFNQQNKLHKIKAKQLTLTPEMYAQLKTQPSIIRPLDDNLFDQLKAAIVTDIARLKNVPDMAQKAAMKVELVKGYLPFINNYIEQGADTPNSIAVRVMVWLFDINDIENALRIGLYLMKTGTQQTPDGFGRDIQTVICDAVYDWSNIELENERTANPYLLDTINALTLGKWVLHPAVHSKMLAMMAKHYFLAEAWRECVLMCNRAEKVNPKAGVKGKKKEALKALEAAGKTSVQAYIDTTAATE